MKKRVRVYKAENGQGNYSNQMGQFLKKAQMGMEQQQAQQPDMQQIVMQVAGLIMPPPEGQGQDPQQIYQSLIQSYGEEAAAQIINAAVSMSQQATEQAVPTEEQMAESLPPVDDLTMQEQLIQEEEERQQQMLNEQYAAEDDEFMNNLLFGDDEEQQQEEQPEAKYGGAQHRNFVKRSLKLAKKQMGDAGNGQGKNIADIYDGALKRSEDFTTNLKNEATLSLLEKQFKNMSQAAPQMQAQSHFAYGGSQFGGVTGYDLDRFVYGGFDPSVPDLIQAQYGYQTNQLFNALNTNEKGITSYAQGVNAANATKNDGNKKLYDQLKASGVNVGEYREGMNYQEIANKLNGASGGNRTNTNYNFQPYSTDNIWDALIPNNAIFGKKYTMSGPVGQMAGAFAGQFDPSKMSGFDIEKERLGFGHKRYTFTPKLNGVAGTGAGTAGAPGTAVDALGRPVTSQKQLEMSYLDPSYLRGAGKDLEDINLFPYSKHELRHAKRDLRQYDRKKERTDRRYDRKNEWINNNIKENPTFGDKLKGSLFRSFTKAAKEGLQTFQGNTTGSSVNNQTTNPNFTIDEQTYVNGTNLLNTVNPLLKGFTAGLERKNQKNFYGYQNQTSDDLNMAVAQRFHGNYNPNSGLFREDQEGQNWQSKYGGVPHMKMGGPKGRTGQQVDYSLGIFPTAMGGSDINQYIGRKRPEIVDTLKPVPREEANLEAEKGETAYGDLNGDGFPEHYEIGGKRHYKGGTPLNLPDDTFIFSDTRSMRISDPKILKMFNRKPKKGGYTPAELAKQYDINEYRKILDDPDSDVVDRKTAEQMIKNFNIKLGALALAQESKKGFPQGIPVAAQPYMETMGIKEEDIIPQEEETQQMAQQVMSQQGMAPQGTMPEEQMAMASQEGMMASPEEMGMSPEAMMRYGGMRRLRRAQEGMQQPSPEEIAMMEQQQAQQQQGAGDQMQQVLQQVQQALQQGAQPEEIAAELIQSQVQPEAVMQIFMQLGVPQEEAAGIVQSVMQEMQGAQQQAPMMAAYGMEMGGYDMPFSYGHPYEMAYGGFLDRYQTKGEVKQRVYAAEDLPEGARIVEKYTRGKKPGDFELQPDGTYRKVTNYEAKPVASSATQQQTAAEFAAQSEENKKLLQQANAIIEREIGRGTILGTTTGGDIQLKGNLNLPFNERIILSRALNSNKNFGTDKFKVTNQSATTGYSQRNAQGKLKGTGSFVAGFTPEDYERRYAYEQLRGMGADDATAFAEVEKIYNDPAQKASLRREYMSFLNMTPPADDAELLDPDFYKTRYSDVTRAMENLPAAQFRTNEAGGDDLISGFDHFDAMGFEYNPEYEAEQQEEEQEDTDVTEEEDVNVPVPQYAPWWLQDTIKTAGAFGDLMGVKKYYPWAPKYNPTMPEPTFLDPTRAIAAQSEQARILGDTMAKLSPNSSLAASRLSGLQGELAKGAADTANQYDKANVEIANQFAPMQAEIANKAQEYNIGATKGLYDANTIMNQQYDNSKRALRHNLLNQYTNAITNRWKTDTLNQLYPQYAVDSSIGGRLDFKGGKPYKPSTSRSPEDVYEEAFRTTNDRDYARKMALLAASRDGYGAAEESNPQAAILSHYDNMAKGGIFVMGPSLLPPFIL